MEPIKRLMGSSKALVMLAVTLLMFIGVFIGKIQFSELKSMLTVLIPAWLGAQGLEDAAKHVAQPSTDRVKAVAVVTAAEVAEAVVKASNHPPPLDPSPETKP